MTQNSASANTIKFLNGLSVLFFLLFVIAQPTFVTDIWWQLRLGDQIRLTHQIPTRDVYSWTCFHRPIVLHEWGSYLAFAEAYRYLGGWSGLWLFQAVLTAVVLLGLYHLILHRIPDNPFVAMVLTVLAGHMCGKFLAPRPHLFTYVCLILSLEILFYCQYKKVTVAAVVLLAAVQVFWANTHAAGPIFIGISLTYAVGNALQLLIYKSAKDPLEIEARRRTVVSLSCAAIAVLALMVNPSGWDIYKIIFDTVGNKTMPSSIGEWLPVNFHDPYGQQVEILMFVIGFVLAATKRSKDIGDVFVLGVLVLAALYALRNVPILALAGTLILAPYIPSAIQSILDRFRNMTILRTFFFNDSPSFAITAAALTAVVFAGAFLGTVLPEGKAASHPLEAVAEAAYMVHNVPEDGCLFLEREKVPTSLRLYNNYDDGAYLIWRLPQYPVFSSTETFVYFGPVLDAYFTMDHLPLDWRSVIAPYDIGLVLTTSVDRQARLFLDAPEWALVYAGGLPADDQKPVTLIFVRRSPANSALIVRSRKDCLNVSLLKSAGYLSAQ